MSADITLASLARAQAEEEQPGRVLRFERVGDIEQAPPEYVVHGLLEAGNLALVFGHSGDGKSFVVLDLAIAGATGRPFAGHSVERVGPWLIAPGEGRAGLLRRARAAAQGQGLDLGMIPLFVANRGAELLSDGGFQELRAAVRAVARLHGPVQGLIIDTLARAIAPGDENSSQDTSEAIRRLDALRHENPGLIIVLVHHSGHQDRERARGSSALRAAVDAEFRITRDTRTGQIVLACSKLKDGELPEPMGFELADEELGLDLEGRPIRSAWARYTGTASTERAPAMGRNQQAALLALEAMHEEHRQRLADAGQNPDQAAVTLTDWRSRCVQEGMHRARFAEAKAGLLASSQVIAEGPHVRPARTKGAYERAPSIEGGSRSYACARPNPDVSDSFVRSYADGKDAPNE